MSHLPVQPPCHIVNLLGQHPRQSGYEMGRDASRMAVGHSHALHMDSLHQCGSRTSILGSSCWLGIFLYMRCTSNKIMILARYCLKKHCDFLRHTWAQELLQHHNVFTKSQLWHSQMTSWYLQKHQGAPSSKYHDVYRSIKGQCPAHIMMFTEAPRASVLHVLWCSQEHQQSVSCMYHDLCRSTNGQHFACIMIFAEAPSINFLHVSWCLQEHQCSVSCMYHDVCRSTNGQCLACIMIFAEAPTISAFRSGPVQSFGFIPKRLGLQPVLFFLHLLGLRPDCGSLMDRSLYRLWTS